MWICKHCNEENDDNFEACWKCGVQIDGNPTENQEEFEKSKHEIETLTNQAYSTEYSSTYGATRLIAQIVAFIGWITVVISGLIFIMTIMQGFEWLRLLPALSGFVSGLFLVMSGQLTRAIVDNTDNTGEALLLLREIADKE